MVAYSFSGRFAGLIQRRWKCQTVRGPRRRHARPGEAVQLYTAMRTRHCRKLVDVDPVCIGVDDVRFDLRELASLDGATGTFRTLQRGADLTLEINGIPLTIPERHDFARRDGFAGFESGTGKVSILPFTDMAWFWVMTHGPRLFEGACIRWEHRT